MAALPDAMIALARVRNGSIEVTNAEQRWRTGDEIVLLSRFGEAETVAALDALTTGRPLARA